MIRYLILCALLCGSAVAGEPACPGSSIGEIVAKIEAAGGSMLELVDVNGQGFDQLLIADFGGSVVVGGFRLGCAVGGPVPLGPSLKKTSI